jgi:hypothetical protein
VTSPTRDLCRVCLRQPAGADGTCDTCRPWHTDAPTWTHNQGHRDPWLQDRNRASTHGFAVVWERPRPRATALLLNMQPIGQHVVPSTRGSAAARRSKPFAGERFCRAPQPAAHRRADRRAGESAAPERFAFSTRTDLLPAVPLAHLFRAAATPSGPEAMPSSAAVSAGSAPTDNATDVTQMSHFSLRLCRSLTSMHNHARRSITAAHSPAHASDLRSYTYFRDRVGHRADQRKHSICAGRGANIAKLILIGPRRAAAACARVENQVNLARIYQ